MRGAGDRNSWRRRAHRQLRTEDRGPAPVERARRPEPAEQSHHGHALEEFVGWRCRTERHRRPPAPREPGSTAQRREEEE
jgi:hypothetical protein